ncbi:hypothetical protein ACFZB9_07265 [Kitasatospora sp. NPDC008050]|uniref:hypothetical protein n=1 Tax=Kitasatospora sp. NPDC008050 TaxID=3364021 RepID=UPI0036EF2B23
MATRGRTTLRTLAVAIAGTGLLLGTVASAQATAPQQEHPLDSTLRGSTSFHNCYAAMYSEVNSVGNLVVQGVFALGVSDRGHACQAYLRRNGAQLSGTHLGYPISQSTDWYYDGSPNTAEVCVGDFIYTTSYSCSTPW